jgi:acetyl esterase/lipase
VPSIALRHFPSSAALLLLAGIGATANAQTIPSDKSRIFLWQGRRAPIEAPRPSYIPDTTYGPTDSVKNPWLLHYAATNPNGAALIIIPGGGYRNLSPWGSEGTPAATRLSSTYGITVFLLRYRLDPYRHPHPMWDVQRAVRWVRAHAAQYGIDPNRIGVLGFSAGGHLASTVATHYDAGLIDSNASNAAHWHTAPKDSIDRYSCKPNFQGLVFPMTTMVRYVPGTTSTAYAYYDGRVALIGNSPSNELVDYLSNEKQVTPQTPPAWINWGTNDQVVNALNSRAYRDSLKAKGVTADTLVISGGGHDPVQTFRADSLGTWLNRKGYLTALAPTRARRGIPEAAWIGSNRKLDALGRVTDRPTGQPLNAAPVPAPRD